MTLRTLVTLTLLLGGSCGCAFRKQPAPQAAVIEALEHSGEAGLVTWEVVAAPEPHAYAVHWRLRDLSAVDTLRIRRESGAGEFQETPVELSDEGGLVIDAAVHDDELYRYELISVGPASPAPLSLARWAVRIPRDEVIAGIRVASSLPPRVSRLFLEPGAALRTEGRDLALEFDEIHSNGGYIDTYGLDDFAGPGATGRSGGTLHIQVKRGTGRLGVVMRGQGGGKGPVGVIGTGGATGERGTPADVGSIGMCPRPPGPGKNGGNGGAGGKGGRGQPGGASGRLEMVVTESSNLDVQPALEGGRGGAGGDGGMGGPGGPGGAGGAMTRFGIEISPREAPFCQPAASGRNGDAGTQGPLGEAGDVGPVDSYCIRNGAQTFGQCPSN